MLSALSLTLVLGANAAPIVPLQKPLANCPTIVAGNIVRPLPSQARSGKLVPVNGQHMRLEQPGGLLCPIPLAEKSVKDKKVVLLPDRKRP